MMKKLTLLLLLSTLSNITFSQLIWSYDFNKDTVGQKLFGKNGWTGKTDKGFPGGGECPGANCEALIVRKDTLSYPNYGTFTQALDVKRNAESLGHFLTNKNVLPDTAFNPSYKNGDKVYVSYLVKFNSAPDYNAGQPAAGQVVRVNGSSFFSVGMRINCSKTNNLMRFGVEKNGAAVVSEPKYEFNKTHLLVMRYTYKDSLNRNDEVALFINPLLSATEPTPDLVTSTGDDIALKSFLIYGTNFQPMATGTLSGIKVSSSWTNLLSSSLEIRNESLSIRPTLADDFIELNMDKAYPSVSNITIVDLQGREVLADILNREETRKTLNINGLATGFYIVSIQNKDFIATQKFVKN
jgi:hypothetical protein